jgi:hypothetical protein
MKVSFKNKENKQIINDFVVIKLNDFKEAFRAVKEFEEEIIGGFEPINLCAQFDSPYSAMFIKEPASDRWTRLQTGDCICYFTYKYPLKSEWHSRIIEPPPLEGGCGNVFAVPSKPCEESLCDEAIRLESAWRSRIIEPYQFESACSNILVAPPKPYDELPCDKVIRFDTSKLPEYPAIQFKLDFVEDKLLDLCVRIQQFILRYDPESRYIFTVCEMPGKMPMGQLYSKQHNRVRTVDYRDFIVCEPANLTLYDDVRRVYTPVSITKLNIDFDIVEE